VLKNKIFAAAVFASFAWNLSLVGGVILGASYALDRAAGGQFEVFPPYIRIVYVLIFMLIVFQLEIFRRSLYGRSTQPEWIIKAFVVIGVLGIQTPMTTNALIIHSLYGRSTQPEWIIKAFVVIGVLGILANAASPSSNERWNVIPAFFITIAFYRMLKPNLKK